MAVSSKLAKVSTCFSFKAEVLQEFTRCLSNHGFFLFNWRFRSSSDTINKTNQRSEKNATLCVEECHWSPRLLSAWWCLSAYYCTPVSIASCTLNLQQVCAAQRASQRTWRDCIHVLQAFVLKYRLISCAIFLQGLDYQSKWWHQCLSRSNTLLSKKCCVEGGERKEHLFEFSSF